MLSYAKRHQEFGFNNASVDFDFKTYHFPKFETPTGQKESELFEKMVRVVILKITGGF